MNELGGGRAGGEGRGGTEGEGVRAVWPQIGSRG